MTRSPRREVVTRCSLWTVVCTVALVVTPGRPGLRDVSLGAGLGAGIVSGGLLCALLARRWPVCARPRSGRGAAAAARCSFLVLRSAYEEALWRGLVLGGLVAFAGTLVALPLSTLGFAAWHWRVHRWRMVVHVLTGGVFAAVLCGTGRLAAAMAAHASYNVLVALALERERGERRDLTARARSPACPAPASTQVVAEARDVVKGFGRLEALRGVSLTLGAGELLGLLGPNGAGKTTLLNILVGLRRPDTGAARLFGLDPRQRAARAAIGVTPQDAAFPPTLRVAEIIDFVRAHFASPRPADELLERFELRALSRRQAGGLSGGERRRLALALAFAGRPRVVFLDEPTTGLDVEARRSVWREVRAHVESGGAVLLTSHQLAEIEELATRVVMLRRGVVVADGSVADFTRRAGLTRVRFTARAAPALPAVESLAREGARHTVYTAEPDRVVVALVRSGAPFSNLEVAPATLEEAFLSLAAEHQEDRP